jgi:hypothetical protein
MIRPWKTRIAVAGFAVLTAAAALLPATAGSAPPPAKAASIAQVASPSPAPETGPGSFSSGTSTLPTAEPAQDVPGLTQPEASPPGRFHLHRPGTDVDGDLLSGNVANEVYILKGNVTLHSDPKLDREVATASESTDPLTLTADEIDVDRAGLTYTAKGHVHFTQGTRSGRADVAVLDQQTHTMDLIGNANVYDGDRRTAADKLHYDMIGKGFLGAGDVRIYEPLPTPNPNATATPAPPKRKRRIPL